MDEFEVKLQGLAPLLNKQIWSGDATVAYHGVCDALVWSDELPNDPVSEEMALRYLLKYRTSVIAGEPIVAIEPYWDLATKLFPNWAGFAPERCTPTARLAALASQSRARLETFLDTEE